MENSRFVGYSSRPKEISESIELAAKTFQSKIANHEIKTWPQVFAPGEMIDENIFLAIDHSECCYFDFSVPNFNVMYEAGYAIGRGKPVVPLVNRSLAGAGSFLNEIGIFDTVGLAFYGNSNDLLSEFQKKELPRPIISPATGVNNSQPIYALLPKILDEKFSRMLSVLSESGVNFRTFDPSEDPRMSLRVVVTEVSQSTAIVCGIAADQMTDSQFNNLRAAFIAGNAAGLNKKALMLNMSGEPLPMDVRDYGNDGSTVEKVATAVQNIAFAALRALQDSEPVSVHTVKSTNLEDINLGNSAAENEARRLADYFISTPAYKQTIGGQARIVIGRKGSGKTAIFAMAQVALQQGRSSTVLALKPDGYQLRKFKDRLVFLLKDGTKEHTIAAFWEYLLLLEICNACINDDARYLGRDHLVTEKLPPLRQKYANDPLIQEGDFSERIGRLLESIDERLETVTLEDGYLSRADITGLLYRHDIGNLRSDVIDYLSVKDSLSILVDNIDKSWDAKGVSDDDILMIRSLLEAGRKLERSLAKIEVQSFITIFLRNDVYELLLDQTPDRGKEGKVAIDWTDREFLKGILRRRLSAIRPELNWSDIAVSHVDGSGSFDWILDRSLMRPRYLLDFASKCIGVAATKGHARIEESDFRSAYGSYSLDVLVSTNLEIRDVKPAYYDTIFSLMNLKSRTSRIDIGLAFVERGHAEQEHDGIIDLLIWYGVLGCVDQDGRARYIYEVEYNIHVLEQLRVNRGRDSELFEINAAFWPALNIDGKGDREPSIRLL